VKSLDKCTIFLIMGILVLFTSVLKGLKFGFITCEFPNAFIGVELFEGAIAIFAGILLYYLKMKDLHNIKVATSEAAANIQLLHIGSNNRDEREDVTEQEQ
ncbi:hypothetical protein AVEN_218950-1, partial [Araneus ventricosus]